MNLRWFGFVLLSAIGVLAAPRAAQAQYCYGYVDGEVTATPLQCVRDGDHSLPCSWASAGSGACTVGVDCCTSIPDTVNTNQTILDMHSEWHSCFGNFATNPPPGRSARWIAFHRQMELDFDLWRDSSVCDPANGERLGCAIEYLPWHEDMVFPYGQGPIGPGHPRGCGATGEQRPGFIQFGSGDVSDGVTCSTCFPFPSCLMFNCDPSVPATDPFSCSGVCPGGSPNTDLSEFTSVEDIASVLDIQLHGAMHGHVADPTGTGQYNQDSNVSSCSPRDPMFWRLHKTLDETTRAWQQTQPVDVTVILDRSGSMSEPDGSGQTKMEVALDALTMFADMLAEDNTESGFTNRLGVVSYSSGGGAELDLQLAEDALPAVSTLDIAPGGCTGIGKGLEYGLQQLCPESVPPGGDETDATCFAAPVPGPDTNARRGIVLLTDGLENIPPCLNASSTSGTCGATCSGEQFDFQRLGITTELCAVGFGEGGATLNGPLLTLLAERQGGVYMETPDTGAAVGDDYVDLKDFFVKCLGTVTSSFQGIDPKGVLAADEMQTEPVSYAGCGDKKLTFASGWDNAEALRLMVNTPSGDLLRHDGSIGGSRTDTYEFDIVTLPYQGEQAGEWRSQLIRPHRSYVNGFTTDSLDPAVSVPLVRRQIQRLCPEGCDSVLYFEDGHLGPASSYEGALQAESDSGLLQSVVTANNAADFTALLAQQSWSLLVYAHQMSQGQAEPYDSALVSSLCSGQAAIVTETREVFTAGEFPYLAPAQINACAGAELDSEDNSNFTTLQGDGLLFEGVHTLVDYGYPRFSYTFNLDASYNQISERQGSFWNAEVSSPAIVAEGVPQSVIGIAAVNTSPERWFINVLADGPHRLNDSPMVGDLRTDGRGLLASFKILPANMPSGGFDDVVATVSVERPALGSGVGQIVQDHWSGGSTPSTTEDFLEGRPAALRAAGALPTELVGPFLMNDEGVDGDLEPNNGHWSVQVPDEAIVDGSYKLRFEVDLTKDGCTMHREFFRTKFVEIEPHAPSTIVDLGPGAGGADIVAELDPTDQFGNPWGPGRGGDIACGPEPACACSPSDITDNGDGTYTVLIHTTNTDRCTVILDEVPVSVSSDPACANDTVPPVIDVSEEEFITICSSAVDPILFHAPEITDNCSVDFHTRPGSHRGRVIESNGVPLAVPVEASHDGTFGIGFGTHLVEWTATDEWGNTTTAVQVVHVGGGISASQNLLLRDRAEVLNRDVGYTAITNYGAAITQVGVEARAGNINSAAPVDLRDRAEIYGSVGSEAAVLIGNEVEITGGVAPFTTQALGDAPNLLDVVIPPPVGGNRTAGSGQTLVLAPGSYGTVLLNSGATLQLQSGLYYFQNLTINSSVNAVVTSDPSGQVPQLFITATFAYRSPFKTPQGQLARVEIGLLGTQPVVLEAELNASFIAPNASVSVGANVPMHFFGSYHAKSLEIRPDTHVHCGFPLELDFSNSESCTDGVQNGLELGIDCGGPCDPEHDHDHGGTTPNSCEPPCEPASYEAETMFHSTGGAVAGGWNVWSNGYVSTTHEFAAGQITLEVVARGSIAANVWPTMVVRVGGQIIGQVSVNSTAWRTYEFSVPGALGDKEIRVSFTNDFMGGGQDRNLYVDKVNILCDHE